MTNKVAIVTGASSGLGLACARALAEAAAALVLSGRRADRLSAFAAEFPATRYRAADLTDDGEVDALIALALAEHGRIDIVVNNAGYMTSGPIAEIDLDKMGRMVRLNVEAAFRLMYASVRHFQANGSGHLINITSTVTRRTTLEAGAYTGTKLAVEALAQALRIELAHTAIRMTDLAPGLIATELHREYAEPMGKKRGITKPLVPADVVRALMFALDQPEHVRIPQIFISPGQSGQ